MLITFLSKHALSTATSILRVVQPAEYLRSMGHTVSTYMIYRYVPRKANIVILHRAIADAYTIRLIKYLKSAGSIVLYDCDDLLFDDAGGEFLCKIGNCKHNTAYLFRAAMKLCDTVLVSTDFLKSRAELFHSDVRVIRNALSYSFLAQATKVYKYPNTKEHHPLVLAYLSGSHSHNEDFKIIETGILKLLNERDDIKLLIVGHLDYSEELRNLGPKLEVRNFIPYKEYASIFKEIDINLVPLINNEDFCHAKSELKYIEASACGIPSICSPTHTYKNVIRHEENGTLCKDSEWYKLLCKLINDPVARKKIGANARHHIESTYTPEIREKELHSIMLNIFRKYNQNNKLQRNIIIAIINGLILEAIVLHRKLRRTIYLSCVRLGIK